MEASAAAERFVSKRVLLRALWVGVAPAALTAATLQFFVPTHVGPGAAPAARFIARLGSEYTVPFAVGMFLLFTALVRYWSPYLPGGQALKATPVAKARRSTRWQAVALALAVAAAAAAGIVLRGSVFESYRVLSASMLPTIEPGDRILVDKRAYGFRAPFSRNRAPAQVPRRGDVIVFRNANPGPPILVKRVIGLPGDHVAVDMGRPAINGRKVPHCDAGLFVYPGGAAMVRGRLAVEYLDDSAYLTVLEPDAQPFPGRKVGPDELFVLGDARGHSVDSRNLNEGRGGGIPVTAVEGRAQRILFEVRRDRRIDWGRIWRSIGLEVHMRDVDVRELQEGVERCLRERPSSSGGGVSAP